MPNVAYYTNRDEPQIDHTWQGELGVALSGAFGSLTKIPGQTSALNFIVAAIGSASSTAYSEEIALELEYISESEVKINGITELVSNLTGAAVTNTATLGIIALASVAAGVTLPAQSVLAISLVGGTAVNAVYNRFLDPITDSFFDNLVGTIDVDVRLKDGNGNVLSGVLYKDGLASHALPGAVQQLLISSVGNPEYPTPSANDNQKWRIAA